jgi:hypothetical protein
MVLVMSRPFKHPDTGIFWFRKRVPDDLRELVGKREEKFSLRTRDPSEAKALFGEAVAKIESRWQTLRRGLVSLSERQAAAMADEIYHEMVNAEKDNPSENRSHRIDALMHDRLREDPKTVSVAIFGDQKTAERFLAVTLPPSFIQF